MVWFELLTGDRAAAAACYRSVFGWRTEQGRVKQECTLFAGDPDLPLAWRYAGGLDDGPSAWLPSAPLWLVYFQIADIDASVQLALELGARVQEGIKSGPVDRVARLLDPQGVPFGLAQAD
ncbi:MAG: VOC family protein [Caldilineaceae bacterium]|nr:VOC family protein [Caldilineaceae bacterium]